MLRPISLAAVLAGAVALPALSPRASPFVGTGLINVITQENQQAGCLNSAMAFTAYKSACAVFTIVETQDCETVYGHQYCTTNYSISTSAGPCGDPFQSGSQYEEGGNRILLCGDGSDAANSFWGVTNGDNELIGQALLQDENDEIATFNTLDGSVPTGSDAKILQQDLGVGASVGTGYSLTWTAQ